MVDERRNKRLGCSKVFAKIEENQSLEEGGRGTFYRQDRPWTAHTMNKIKMPRELFEIRIGNEIKKGRNRLLCSRAIFFDHISSKFDPF